MGRTGCDNAAAEFALYVILSHASSFLSTSTLHLLCRVRSTSTGTLGSYRSLKNDLSNVALNPFGSLPYVRQSLSQALLSVIARISVATRRFVPSHRI